MSEDIFRFRFATILKKINRVWLSSYTTIRDMGTRDSNMIRQIAYYGEQK